MIMALAMATTAAGFMGLERLVQLFRTNKEVMVHVDRFGFSISTMLENKNLRQGKA